MTDRSAKYRVMLADDHELIRHGLRNIISGSERMEVVGEVGDSETLLGVLNGTSVDLLVLDISMPKINGIELTEIFKKSHPDLKILILTMHQNIGFLRRAVAAGADGYLVKTDCGQEILSAIEKIQQGQTYISPSLEAEFSADVIRSWGNTSSSQTFRNLTNREKQVLTFVVEGLTSKQIAAELDLSPRTVEHHRARLLQKFNLKKSVDLVNFAIKNGYVTLE